jgi:hypothetical protein
MDVLRKLGLGLAVTILIVSSLTLAFFAGLYSLASSPQTLENTLSGSTLFTQLQQTIVTQASSSLPDDPGVQAALSQAVSPTFLQHSSQQIVANVYSWMQGTAATPNFAIDISSVKTSFANNITTYLQQKLITLPPCTERIAPPESLDDILALTCLPPNITPETIADTAHQDVLNSNLLGVDNTIDISNGIGSTPGKTLTEQLAIIPQLYHFYLLSLYILPVILLLCSLVIVFLSATRRGGIKRVAWLYISTGIVSGLAAAGSVWLLGILASLLGSTTTPGELLTLIQTLASDIRQWWLIISSVYIVFGIILLTTVRLTRPRLRTPQSGNIQDAKIVEELPSHPADELQKPERHM